MKKISNFKTNLHDRNGTHLTKFKNIVTSQETNHEKQNKITHTGSVVARDKKKTVHIVNNQDDCEKYATDKKKDIKIMRLRNNATFGTWNVRTLNRTGNLEELEHEMKKYA